MKLKSADGTEINARGPVITEEALQHLMQKLDMLEKAMCWFWREAFPQVAGNHLQDILHRLTSREILTVVDATGNLLCNVLEHHPFLIKPNHHELGEIFDVTIDDMEKVKIYAGKLQEQGARNVLVSMGGKGAAR